jgi:cytochrome c553
MVPAAVLMAGLFVASNLSFAKPEYQKKEKGTTCKTCHDKGTPSKNNLNDVGKCYGDHKHVLDGCQAKKG